MGIFDTFGEKFQDVAKKSGELAQKTAKKSGELLEITKLNLKIKEEENGIKGNYEEIGQYIYEKYGLTELKSVLLEELLELIDLIQVKKAAIGEIQKKIEDIKNADAAEPEKKTVDFDPGLGASEEIIKECSTTIETSEKDKEL